MELQEAVALVLRTPGETVHKEILFYDVLLFVAIEVSAAVSLMAGLAFPRGNGLHGFWHCLLRLARLVAV